MLVITRTPNKSLYIGGEIRLKVIKVLGESVSLGISAPKNMRIVRSEQERKSSDNGSITSGTEVLK
ncbi:carbon storage regulator [Pseudomonas carnis]|uniref:carbon storage regulator n=1 Tax=Pseudomonas carnis TaxID=2487355 RepID=UPI0018E65EFF|nr:carbon storage regulator [Pseudomonas carnis]MBI6685349.1 carbon storage regulator [Pseudomonas carnis]